MSLLSDTTSQTYSDPETLYLVAHQILQQAIDLLNSIPDDQVYAKPSHVMFGGSIGKHIRHLYDHFELLLVNNPSLEHNKATSWIVDFDARSRDVPMERHRDAAQTAFARMQDRINNLKHRIPHDTPVTLAATIDAASTAKYMFNSTLDRELWYCCMHAIHHYAAIKAICVENGLSTPKEFGLAPSTAQHQHQLEEQQRSNRLQGHL
ncbi:hypothetical protein VTP01DRAFT_1313 [Rhizomucor pusillus]|uniref:uncharacterized protein n=1 Tax=Rhizomucor pusillus TaxID=4840 RepID=UPI0037449DFF